MKRLVVIGAGRNGSFFMKLFSNSEYEKIFLYDNDPGKWGQCINGEFVISKSEFEELVQADDVEIVIATEAWREIRKQLCDLHVESKVVFTVCEAFNRFIPLEMQVLSKYSSIEAANNWECIDSEGEPVPWYTYPAIEYLKQIDFSSCNIFEYGCGYSSLFWANNAKRVVSVEHNKDWATKIQNKRIPNLEIILKDNIDDYCKAIMESDEKYDVIVIDGVQNSRKMCSEYAIQKISDTGIIIFDNSDRSEEFEEYRKVLSNLRKLDFIEVDFHGMGPLNNFAWTTTLFISRKNQLSRKQAYIKKCIGAISETI